MLNRLHIGIILGVAVAVWTVVLIVRGIPVTPDLLVPYGIAVSAVTLLCVGFNRWCWHYGIFKGWLVQRPLLQGTWRVRLQSSWINPETGQGIEPIDAHMSIHQTFSLLKLRLFTKESASASVSASVLCAEDGAFKIVATYQNEPSAELRGVRSEIHFGTLMLDVHSDPANALSGHYWTDRKTTGTMDLSERSTKQISSFAEGQTLFGNKS